MAHHASKGRVTLSGVVVLEGGRILDLKRSTNNHMFDGHFYIPGCEDSLAALRYFNKGEPLLTPYAYFVNAQVYISVFVL
jgi:hypothetical protein